MGAADMPRSPAAATPRNAQRRQAEMMLGGVAY